MKEFESEGPGLDMAGGNRRSGGRHQGSLGHDTISRRGGGRIGFRKSSWFGYPASGCQRGLGSTPALPITCFVTLGRLHALPEPHLFHLYFTRGRLGLSAWVGVRSVAFSLLASEQGSTKEKEKGQII